MPSLQSYTIRYYLHYLKRKTQHKTLDIHRARQVLETIGKRSPMAENTRTESLSVSGIPAEWVRTPQSQAGRIVMYLHGGAYLAGSLASHRGLASQIGHCAQAEVLQVDYRLAPEHPFPAGLEDALTAYAWLQQQFSPAQIVLAGDSAGGGLALATLLKLREEGHQLPAALVLLAPWVDLEARSPTLEKLAHKDPILSSGRLRESARAYCGTHSPQNPFISPLNADLSGLPPVLIQVGTLDILLGEAEQLARKIQAQGGKVQLEVWKNMIHVWQFISDRLPEARKALQNIGTFIQQNAPSGVHAESK
ncbi:MAG: alpha/beta hydrolase [Microscillaceae bacterium]|nr:alpha/beta hydrolase [Microscillaceae bacterium]